MDAVRFVVLAGGERTVIAQPVSDWMPDGIYRITIWTTPDGTNSVVIASSTFRIGSN
jgi:hypothetical protein